MYRCLNVESLGVTGRQSELIELALTYRFKGMDLDLAAFAKQVEARGLEYSGRCIKSAELHIGAWNLPVRWQGEESKFKADLQKLPAIASVAASVGADRCVTNVMAGSNTLPLQDNFEFHRARLSEIADLLAPHGISLGLGFEAAAASREGLAHQFIVEAEALLTLISTINSANLGLLLDTWNWHLGGGAMQHLASLAVEKIVSVRVADAPAGASAASITLRDRLLPSPTGVVPNAAILTKLSELSYEGPVTPLPHPSQFKGVTRDKNVKQAAEAMISVWPGAELVEEEAAEAGDAAPPSAAGDAGEANGVPDAEKAPASA